MTPDCRTVVIVLYKYTTSVKILNFYSVKIPHEWSLVLNISPILNNMPSYGTYQVAYSLLIQVRHCQKLAHRSLKL